MFNALEDYTRDIITDVLANIPSIAPQKVHLATLAKKIAEMWLRTCPSWRKYWIYSHYFDDIQEVITEYELDIGGKDEMETLLLVLTEQVYDLLDLCDCIHKSDDEYGQVTFDNELAANILTEIYDV